jgi:hypothetical protein
MAVEDDYTEERLAEYDRDAIAQGDVIVMGFVTVVRNLRVRVLELEARLARETVSWSVWCEPLPEANGREARWIDDGGCRPHPTWTKDEAEGEAAKWSRINKHWSYEVRPRDRSASSKTKPAD